MYLGYQILGEREPVASSVGGRPAWLRGACRGGSHLPGGASPRLSNQSTPMSSFRSSRLAQAEPLVPAFYSPPRSATWAQRTRILSVRRVENPGLENSANGAYRNLVNALKVEGTKLVGGVHSRWLFHGTDASVAERIALNPMRGFTAIANRSDGKKLALWGEGVYFARDAQYPDDFGFATKSAADGTKCVLLCLVLTGHSCLGGADVQLHLQTRNGQGSHGTYDSLVDDLANPEIFVVEDGGRVFPAYVIQYAGGV